MNYYLTRTLCRPFDATLADVTASLETEGFVIMSDVDVQSALTSNIGADMPKHRVLTVYHPRLAREVLQREGDPGALLPFNVAIRQLSGEQVEIASVDPLAAIERSGNLTLRTAAEDMRRQMSNVFAAIGTRRRAHPFPHVYVAAAKGDRSRFTEVDSPGLPAIKTAVPPEFGGPRGMWSPETLLCAAIVDCFFLTFRSLSRAADIPWSQLECRVEGVLERVERVSQFTRFTLFADLTLAAGADEAKARHLLEKAEEGCRVLNSLSGAHALEIRIVPPGATQRAAQAALS